VNATGVTAGPAESNGRLLLSKWRDSLHVTCRLTACTPGSAPGPTLGNEYGKTLPFLVWYEDESVPHQKGLCGDASCRYDDCGRLCCAGRNTSSLVVARCTQR